MADNADLTIGDGTLVAGADDIGGVKYPRVKLIIGDDGTNDGDVSGNNPLPVALVGVGTVAITGTVTVAAHAVVNVGTFAVQAAQAGTWNVTNISGTVSLPTGASTAAKQPALGTAGTASTDVLSVQGIASMTPLLATVTGNLTNISGTISLPTGAATAAKQPALGTAGTAAADVISVQGIAAMTPLLATVTGNLTNISGTISLPTGAATAAKQPAIGTAGTAAADVISIQGIAAMTPILATVTGNLTNISGTVSLPTGASTAAKQPALGTAGTAAADVLTVQGIASMTALKVDPSGVTSPVSATRTTTYGTATAFTKTNANIAASVTAGWKSNAIDNTTTKALDALVSIELAAVNTAPAGTKTLYIYAYGLISGTAYTSTGDGTIDGTEGTVTFPSVTTLPVVLRLIGTVPYPVQNKAINAGPFSVAQAFPSPAGGVLPDKWGIAYVNDMGQTLNVTNIFYQEIKNTLG